MKNVKMWFSFFRLAAFLLFPQICFSKILDSNGVILQEVISIFHQYKPLIEEMKKEISEKRKVSVDQINRILNPETSVCDISLKHLNDIAQVVFLRPVSLERKDLVNYNNKYLPYTNNSVEDLFRAIGDIEDVNPKKKCYRYILINGSTIQNMRLRLNTLIHLVESGKIHITPETEVIFLTGARDLFPEENEQQLMSTTLKINKSWVQSSQLPQTEDQAAEWIWNQTDLPVDLRNAKITFVRAKKKEIVDPNTKLFTKLRPSTFDTIKTWINEYNPAPGNCLSISSQPFVYYQEVTICGFFDKMGLTKKGFSVEGSGNQNDKMLASLSSFKQNIPILLDNLARTIYTLLG